MSNSRYDDSSTPLTSSVAGRLLTRSISLPVQACLSHPWPEFLRLLHNAWVQSTSLANWAAHTLRAHDVVRTPGMDCLPPMPPVDLYALAFGRARSKPARKEGKPDLPVVAAAYDGCAAWEGARIAAASLLRQVQRKYVKERPAIVWRRERRSPEFLYPFPFPVHPQVWVASLDGAKRPIVHLALPGARVAVRLRADPSRPAQVELFRRLADGELKQQQIVVARQRAHASHRREDTGARAGGQQVSSYRIMFRIAVQVEAAECDPMGVMAEACTARDPFLSLTLPGAEPLLWHAGHVRGWIAAHEKFRRDFSDETKYEKRWPSRKRRALNRRLERGCDRHANRVRSFLQETAAQVVGHCKRRGAGRLRLDSTDRSFAESFPWFSLVERMKQKCDEAGLIFTHHFAPASGAEVERHEEDKSDSSDNA